MIGRDPTTTPSRPLTLEPPRQQGHGAGVGPQPVTRTGQDPQLGARRRRTRPDGDRRRWAPPRRRRRARRAAAGAPACAADSSGRSAAKAAPHARRSAGKPGGADGADTPGVLDHPHAFVGPVGERGRVTRSTPRPAPGRPRPPTHRPRAPPVPNPTIHTPPPSPISRGVVDHGPEVVVPTRRARSHRPTRPRRADNPPRRDIRSRRRCGRPSIGKGVGDALGRIPLDREAVAQHEHVGPVTSGRRPRRRRAGPASPTARRSQSTSSAPSSAAVRSRAHGDSGPPEAPGVALLTRRGLCGTSTAGGSGRSALERVQLAQGAGPQHPVHPLGELLLAQTPFGEVALEHGREPVAIGVRGARSTRSGPVPQAAGSGGCSGPVLHDLSIPQPRPRGAGSGWRRCRRRPTGSQIPMRWARSSRW